MESKEQVIRKWIEFYNDGGGIRPTEHHRLVMKLATRFKGLGINTILDVGCGRGFLSKELAIQRFAVTSTEIVPEIVSELSSEDGISAFPYSIGDLDKLGSTFDLVLAIDLLEHLKAPRIAIRKMAALADIGMVVSGKKYLSEVERKVGALHATESGDGFSCHLVIK